jgi:transposase-like protein
VLERLAPLAPQVCELLEQAEEDLIGFYAVPREHWTKIRSTNPLERVNKEIDRRSDVVGTFPNDQAVIRLAVALRLEQNDKWLVQRRYLSAESIALVLTEPTDPAGKAEDVARLCRLNPSPLRLAPPGKASRPTSPARPTRQ